MTTNEPPNPPPPGSDPAQPGGEPAPATPYGGPPAYQTPPPPGSTPPPAPGGYGGGTQRNDKALWSMILGILSIVCCGLVAGIPAIILGNMAKKEIAASQHAQEGEGMAQAGFIMGIIGTVLSVLGLIVYIFVFAAAVSTSEFDGSGL